MQGRKLHPVDTELGGSFVYDSATYHQIQAILIFLVPLRSFLVDVINISRLRISDFERP
jgi:hypothetical protein